MKQKLLLKSMLLLFALIAGNSSVWAETATLTNAQIVAAGSGDSGYKAWAITGGGGTWNAYAIKNQHSKATSSYHYLQIKKYASSTAYYIQVPELGTKITSITMTVSGSSQPMDGGSNTATLYFSASNSTSATGTGVASGTGASSVTIDCSSLNLNTGYITASAAVRIWDVAVTYTPSGGSSAEATTTTIDASGITNTNKFVSTTAGSLSASVTYGTPAAAVPAASVSWSGNNDAVATINASTGAVTLVGEGTVTFTATYDGVEDEYSSSSDTYEMTVTDEDPSLATIWSEDFSTYDAEDVPAGGTYSYACTNGSGTTRVYSGNNAGGTAPELLIGNTNGTLSATITLLNPTYAYSGDLTLKFKSNANAINVKTTTDGITVDGEENEGDGLTFSTKDTHKVTFKGVTTATENITIVFTATTGNNVRLDDIVLKGKQAELSIVATPSISPASGAIVSGTEVTMTCATDGATIYYTTNGDTPTSGSTPYDPEDKPTITSACTIKAIGIKAGLSNSSVASASYTIAEPCATPTFSPAAGEVEKGSTVTISCETGGATIYYTTDGTDPTTSSSVYSSAITINSAMTIKAIAAKEGNANSAIATATYTVIDYATLPFGFDGGKTQVEATVGLTHTGLGSDYDNSPKLKFDSTSDELILKINDNPSILTFDIKGNSFSGGTFKVQTSADGIAYMDLKSYPELGAVSHESLVLASTVRYIKWIYTNKSSGNVALGRIGVNCDVVTVTSAGYATYVPSRDLDFSETAIKAYKVKVASKGKATLTPVDNVPAGTPVLLYTAGGATENIPVTTGAAAFEDGTNDLVAGTGAAVPTEDGAGNTNMILNNIGGNIGFYFAAGQTVATNRAYLHIATSLAPDPMAGAPMMLVFDDETTGINAVNGEGFTVNGSVYDLQGRRVAQPTKGLYIVNGKKVVIK